MSNEEPNLKRELVGLVDDTAKEVSNILDACRKEGRPVLIENC